MVDVGAVRATLTADREVTLERIAALEADFAGIVSATTGVATDDEHDPEGATIAFERAAVSALLDQARDHLAAVDHAVDRLAAGDYGTCERCGAAIGPARLAARPVATTCITCAAVRR